MQHLVLVGACYLDTILSVPYCPEEDAKLRATKLQVRRGGNCPNSLEVLQGLLHADAVENNHQDQASNNNRDGSKGEGKGKGTIPLTQTHLISPLPERGCASANQILSSFGEHAWDRTPGTGVPPIDFSHCLYRTGHAAPASSYVIRSIANGSRTIVNYNDLPDMTVDEFSAGVDSLTAAAATPSSQPAAGETGWWWHFEGRIPDVTLECVRAIRRALPGDGARISVEVEKPGREGLRELADEADVVFYSRSWAEANGYASAEECLKGETPSRAFLTFCTWGADGAACLPRGQGECLRCPVEGSRDVEVVDAIGAGDTFMAGAIYGLTQRADRWQPREVLRFAVRLATLKVQREGFENLATDVADLRRH